MWNLTISKETGQVTNLFEAVESARIGTNEELYQFKTEEEAKAKIKSMNAYERSFIESQIKAIQAQKDAYDADRDREIAECQEILAEMDKVGITTEVASGGLTG